MALDLIHGYYACVSYTDAQIGKILEYVDKLNEIDTDGIRPTSHAISLTNAFREDEQSEHMERELALANAPEKEDGNFIVPKIIE